MAKEYTNLFQFKDLQNVPKLEIFVGKYTIWQPWKSLKKFGSINCLGHVSKAEHASQIQGRQIFLGTTYQMG
jgi:hypothetical protein